jgi:N-acetylglucosamine malate deacetylase 2
VFQPRETSTLHGRAGDLTIVCATELEAAARILGIARTRLLTYPDMHLPGIPIERLAADVVGFAQEVGATDLVTFDIGGVTGHPDHERATAAALAAAGSLDLPVIGWAVPQAVADLLNSEFGTAFAGRSEDEIDWTLPVSRTRQWQAIAAHASQSADNPVLHRHLRLQGGTEHLRILRAAGPPPEVPPERADRPHRS